MALMRLFLSPRFIVVRRGSVSPASAASIAFPKALSACIAIAGSFHGVSASNTISRIYQRLSYSGPPCSSGQPEVNG